ncbi:MAG: LysE family translocator [Rhodospirillales bacterium]|nr:LysE family translocator [Rhodospirillales bacterium]
MDFLSWLQVLTICILGAMSPGPSLAVVLRNTISGGKRQGVLTGIGHGLGIFFYAGLVVTGLAVALAAAPQVELALSYGGILLLVWLGCASLTSNGDTPQDVNVSGQSGFISGFLIAFLNPKIAVFFLAVFSPFLRLDAGGLEKAILALTAGTVDTLWYVLVALFLSGSVLTRYAAVIEKTMGVLLLLLAAGLVYRVW